MTSRFLSALGFSRTIEPVSAGPVPVVPTPGAPGGSGKPAAPPPADPPATREAIPDTPFVEGLVRVGLALAGIVLIVIGCRVWLQDEGNSVATTVERTTIKERSAASASKKMPHLRASKRTTKETTDVKGPVAARSTADAPQSVHRRSDTMAIAFLGFGTVLLLTSGLYRRLSKLTLPGGSGLEFLAITRATPSDISKIAQKSVAFANKPGVHQDAPELAGIAIAQLEEEKRQALLAALAPPETPSPPAGEGIYPSEYLTSAESPPDEYFEGVVRRAIRTFQPDDGGT